MFVSVEASLLDPDAMDDRTSTASSFSTRRANFREDLLDGDETCVITGSEPFGCEGCHIIPHAKGDQVSSETSSTIFTPDFPMKYIKNLAVYRGNLDLDDINDPRNGLLLYTGLHRVFGLSQLAFLQVSYDYHSYST